MKILKLIRNKLEAPYKWMNMDTKNLSIGQLIFGENYVGAALLILILIILPLIKI